MEDAAPLREVTHEFLKVAGYAVLEPGDSSEALEFTESYDAETSLLITDFVLPGINGRARAERLVSRRPAIKVLYISSPAIRTTLWFGTESPQSDIAFLKKPFSQEDLVFECGKSWTQPYRPSQGESSAEQLNDCGIMRIVHFLSPAWVSFGQLS